MLLLHVFLIALVLSPVGESQKDRRSEKSCWAGEGGPGCLHNKSIALWTK